MRFPDAPAPAHGVPEVSGPALPIGRGVRGRRRGYRRQRLWGRRRGSRDGRWRFGGYVRRVAVAGDQRLDHLDDFVAVGRRIRVQQRRHLRQRRRRRAANDHGGRRTGRRRRWRYRR